MHLTETPPGPCSSCGRGMTPRNDGSKVPFVDLERDINWSDPLVLCEDCVLQLGGLMGMPNPELLHDLQRAVKKAKEENHELEARIASMERRAKKVGIVFAEEAA